MSQEFPKNEKEISDAEWEQLKKDGEYYSELIKEKTKNASRSAQHILKNIYHSFHPILIKRARSEKSSKEEKIETYESAIDGLNYVKRYFKLLEDFPEFAEKELKPGGGYFPEMMSQLSGSKQFVDAYEAKLRNP